MERYSRFGLLPTLSCSSNQILELIKILEEISTVCSDFPTDPRVLAVCLVVIVEQK